jgi:glycosyltransferase involved in cell wall biosynthesis
MRIAIVNWTRRHVGGAETYLGRLIPALRRTGHDLYFWHETDEPSDRRPIAGALDLPSGSPAAGGLAASLRGLEHWRPDVLYVHGLTDPAIEERLLAVAPAVLFGHNYYGTCITGAKTTNFPAVQPCTRRFGAACLAQFYPRRCGGLSPLTLWTDYRRQQDRHDLLQRYFAIMTLSEHMRAEYSHHGVQGQKIHRVPSLGDDTADRSPTVKSTAAAPGPHGRTWKLAFIGRVDPIKGCRLLLEALTVLRTQLPGRIVLAIAGDGSELAHCRRIASRMRLPEVEVDFRGWISAEQRRDLLDDSDALVMPSVWPEPHGLAGLEALRAGVPVVAFAVGGIPEWLADGENGTLAPADPPTAAGLASAIARCLMAPGIRSTVASRRAQLIIDESVDEHLRVIMPVFEAAGRSL